MACLSDEYTAEIIIQHLIICKNSFCYLPISEGLIVLLWLDYCIGTMCTQEYALVNKVYFRNK